MKSWFGKLRLGPPDAAEPRASSATELWTYPAGWSIRIPVGWSDDYTTDGMGFVPPGAEGRLSVFALRAPSESGHHDPTALEDATRFASVLGLPKPDASTSVERFGPDHLGVALEGKSNGRDASAMVHLLPGRLIVCAVWHTQTRSDRDWADGVLATRSVRASAPMEAAGPSATSDIR